MPREESKPVTYRDVAASFVELAVLAVRHPVKVARATANVLLDDLERWATRER